MTIEAEYVALSTSYKDLFPIVDDICEHCSVVDLDIAAIANIPIKIHEDSVKCRCPHSCYFGASAHDPLLKALCNQIPLVLHACAVVLG